MGLFTTVPIVRNDKACQRLLFLMKEFLLIEIWEVKVKYFLTRYILFHFIITHFIMSLFFNFPHKHSFSQNYTQHFHNKLCISRVTKRGRCYCSRTSVGLCSRQISDGSAVKSPCSLCQWMEQQARRSSCSSRVCSL